MINCTKLFFFLLHNSIFSGKLYFFHSLNILLGEGKAKVGGSALSPPPPDIELGSIELLLVVVAPNLININLSGGERLRGIDPSHPHSGGFPQYKKSRMKVDSEEE